MRVLEDEIEANGLADPLAGLEKANTSGASGIKIYIASAVRLLQTLEILEN